MFIGTMRRVMGNRVIEERRIGLTEIHQNFHNASSIVSNSYAMYVIQIH